MGEREVLTCCCLSDKIFQSRENSCIQVFSAKGVEI